MNIINGSRLLTCFSLEDRRSSGVAQHPADHRPVIGVEAVVTHGAPDPVVPHLHSPSPSTRHQTHDHCGDKGAATKQVQESVHSAAAPLRLPDMATALNDSETAQMSQLEPPG